MINPYLQVLGVKENATLNEIKEAYRRKAKKLHPDVNPAPDAQQQFVLLTEAYEYLQNRKSGKVYSQRKHGYTKQSTPYGSDDEWKEKERERSRRRAREHAEMKYREYVNSEYYKNAVAVNILADFLGLVGLVAIIFGAPILSYTLWGPTGLAAGGTIGLLFLLSAFVIDIPGIRFQQVWPSAKRVSRHPSFHLFAAGALNIFLFFRIGFNTFISVNLLLIIFGVALALGFLVSLMIKNRFWKSMLVQGVAPGVINVFFLLNFLFSGNPERETYNFKHTTQRTKYRTQKTSFVILQGNRYSDFQAIRFFPNYAGMRAAKKVSYEIEEGLFGIRVLKGYEFE